VSPGAGAGQGTVKPQGQGLWMPPRRTPRSPLRGRTKGPSNSEKRQEGGKESVKGVDRAGVS